MPEPPFDANGDPQGLLELNGDFSTTVVSYAVTVARLNVKLEHGTVVVPAGYTYYPKWTSC
jgi:hypothetical protein